MAILPFANFATIEMQFRLILLQVWSLLLTFYVHEPTYFVHNGSIQQQSPTGKATHIRQPVRAEISLAEQRGSIGDAALPRSGKRYFTDSESYRVDAFKACGDYLRKLGRKGGDVFE